MATFKMVTYGDKGVGKTEITATEQFVRFMFSGFKPKRKGHYAEMYDQNGVKIATKGIVIE